MQRILVVTGDHGLADSTKAGGGYSAADLALHRAMRDALESLPEYEFEFLVEHADLLGRIMASPPDFVLNFCDTGFRNVPTQELHLPALLELQGIPYSGAPPAAMVLAYDKAVVRLIAAEEGIAVPAQRYLRPGEDLDAIDPFFPALMKPACGDGSVGITQDAVVRDRPQAASYLAGLRAQLPDAAVLYQEYLPGPEYGLALVGNPGQGFRAWPPLEVDFSALPAGLNPILSFESKTMPDSPYYTDIRYRPARLEPEAVAALRSQAERLFERLCCRDYARFDYRVGADGGIKLMEVNPNPAWDCEAKLALMAGFAGLSYAQMLRALLETALARVAH